MSKRRPPNLDGLDTPEVQLMFWFTRPLHLLLIHLFFEELNKIHSNDARIYAFMYCGMSSMNYPMLETIVKGGIICAGTFSGMFLLSVIPGNHPFYILGGGILGGLIPAVALFIRTIFRVRKCIPEGLEKLGYKLCPICGWYFNEEVECMCNETESNNSPE